MDKVNQKMRKFNLRGVLIGLRATALGNSPHKLDATGIEETLRSEHFQVAKVRHTDTRLLLYTAVMGRGISSLRNPGARPLHENVGSEDLGDGSPPVSKRSL